MNSSLLACERLMPSGDDHAITSGSNGALRLPGGTFLRVPAHHSEKLRFVRSIFDAGPDG